MKKLWLLAYILLCPVFALAQSVATPRVIQEAVDSPSGAPSPATPAVTLKEAPKNPLAETPPVKSEVNNNAFSLPPEKLKPARVTRFEKPPAIDGLLDEEAWKQATVFRDFYQIQPGDNIPPSQAMEALIGYDDKFLYIAFRAFDEPGKVRATVAKRDDVFDDDNVQILLDTYNDKRKAYMFVFNPLGVQADAVLTEGEGEDYSVDILMESKGVITEKGYSVEVAIPFKSLRYEAGKDKLWGVHFFRRIKRYNNELNSWMPIARDKSSLLNQAGHITGLEGISSERTLEIIPSLTISQTGNRVSALTAAQRNADPTLSDKGRFVNSPLNVDPGLTMKLGITPTVTLDMALNPDFAQVEADQLVVTANQRFPIFYQERRPFFLEGIDIFRTWLRPVHTRAIVDPDAAVKLTGKLGRNTFGLMLASDNAPGNYTEDERTSIRENNERFLADQNNPRIPVEDRFPFDNRTRLVGRNSTIGVLRLKRDVGKENSLGLIATTSNFVDRHNHLAGFDGRFKLDKQTTLDFQVLGTNSRRRFYDPDSDRSIYRTGNGFAYGIGFEKAGRNFGLAFTGEGSTNDYRADVGFTRRTNTNREGLRLRYNSDPNPKAHLVSWDINNYTHIDFDFQGRMQIWESEVQVSWNFQRQTYIGGGFEIGYERVFEEEFGAKRAAGRAGALAGDDNERSSNKRHFFLYGGTRPSKKYAFEYWSAYRIGHFDYDFGAGPRFPRVSPAALLDQNAPFDPGAGNLLELEASFIYQPTDELRASLNYTKSRLVRNDTGRVAFDDNILSLRTTYQFTRFTFARARVDYTTLDARMKAQFLLGWTPNPGTSFYVGYNDDLNRNGFNPFTGQLEPGFRRNGRTFFIKASYLFRRGL